MNWGASALQPPIIHGPTRPTARKQLLTVLEHFVDVLDSESLVFSHNLGVHSGTAVIEDLIARKLWELCNRAHTLITMKDNCMETFLKFCEHLSHDKRNRLLTAFVVFDKGDLLDYVQLVKPHLVRDPFMKPLTSAEQQETGTRTSVVIRTQTVKERDAPAALRGSQAAAAFVSRVEALRSAGHPFLKIVDKLITARLPTSVHLFSCSWIACAMLTCCPQPQPIQELIWIFCMFLVESIGSSYMLREL
jgi:hypothetical protein